MRITGNTAFQWKTTEQIWPFEKNRNGNVLYCKEMDLGAIPSYPSMIIYATGTDFEKIHNLYVTAVRPGATGTAAAYITIPFQSGTGDTYDVEFQIRANGDIVVAGYDALWNNFNALARIIYAK